MSRWLLAVFFSFSSFGLAAAQIGSDVRSGVNSNSGAMSGPFVDRVAGINANGTPRQQSPGSSMTNGAGNSYMTPGLTGVSPGNAARAPVPSLIITAPTLHKRPAKPGP